VGNPKKYLAKKLDHDINQLLPWAVLVGVQCGRNLLTSAGRYQESIIEKLLWTVGSIEKL